MATWASFPVLCLEIRNGFKIQRVSGGTNSLMAAFSPAKYFLCITENEWRIAVRSSPCCTFSQHWGSLKTNHGTTMAYQAGCWCEWRTGLPRHRSLFQAKCPQEFSTHALTACWRRLPSARSLRTSLGSMGAALG
ncbi:unnamed protein product [Ostreobium quekettii]|uniref:Uncharacterized protein n=1 Tax=Ostreobium quekettii TaxID=121088 RepID=A0A8S1J0L9_9CHLO|nr:unnamed protein product [Ostreobium quekettii]